MQSIQLTLSPIEAHEMEVQYRIVKRSIDARQRNLKVLLTILQDDNENYIRKDSPVPLYITPVFEQTNSQSPHVNIIGCGPAGIFAALTLLQHGIRPIIYERGKEIGERKKDIALLNRNEGLNEESNYCFGEGGAGTFSDGKLFSRSKKRGDMQRVMELFHYFGANDTILYETHAHIGSDKLPNIIRNMRECIISHGGEIHFQSRIDNPILLCKDAPTILAIGHSAHDTYRILAHNGVAMEAKGSAMGVRVEHPQSLINKLMYHINEDNRSDLIHMVGNASYSLVSQVNGRGVYSFCMCPGGHIVPAGSSKESCIVNGMSASHRNSPFANSGIVVEQIPAKNALDALDFQEKLEHTAWLQTKTTQAPAQRLEDFVNGRISNSLPPCSYLPGIIPSRLDLWLPKEIGGYLREGFKSFDKKYRGFITNEAVILGVESRSSSPIRIIRDNETMQSISHPNLYPCGEGAGYAGGITSSALDGINAAKRITHEYGK